MRFVNIRTIKQATAITGMVILAAQACGNSSSAEQSFKAGGSQQILSSGIPSFGHTYSARHGSLACRWAVYNINKFTGAKRTIKSGDYTNAKLSFPSEPKKTRVFIKSNAECGDWVEVE